MIALYQHEFVIENERLYQTINCIKFKHLSGQISLISLQFHSGKVVSA